MESGKKNDKNSRNSNNIAIYYSKLNATTATDS